MAFLAPVTAWLGTAAGVGTMAAVTTAATVGSLLLRPGAPKLQASTPLPTRNDAAERAAAADALARRTGARGQKRTPTGGAEALTGPKTSLLGRSG